MDTSNERGVANYEVEDLCLQLEELSREMVESDLDLRVSIGAIDPADAAKFIRNLAAERDHYKAKTAAAIGFTHEPTGRRITVYADDKATLDALLYTPGIVEALREIETAVKTPGAPRAGTPAA